MPTPGPSFADVNGPSFKNFKRHNASHQELWIFGLPQFWLRIKNKNIWQRFWKSVSANRWPCSPARQAMYLFKTKIFYWHDKKWWNALTMTLALQLLPFLHLNGQNVLYNLKPDRTHDDSTFFVIYDCQGSLNNPWWRRWWWWWCWKIFSRCCSRHCWRRRRRCCRIETVSNRT